MRWTFFKHELKTIATSKKNALFVFSLLLLIVLYAFLILPNTVHYESFQPEVVKEELVNNKQLQERRIQDNETGFIQFIGSSPYATTRQDIQLQQSKLIAFENHNIFRYLHLRMFELEKSASVLKPELSFSEGSPFPGKDRNHEYHQTLMRYQDYMNQNVDITFPMIEEKTAIQQVVESVNTVVVYLILFLAIYFSADILTRNRENQTLLQGIPISWYQQINLKSWAAFVYTLGIAIFLGLFAFFMIGIQFGFGTLEAKLPVTTTQDFFDLRDYDYMEMSTYLLLTLSFVPILYYLWIRLSTLIGLLSRNMWIVLIVGTILLFAERIYFSRQMREIAGFNVSNFPQTYLEFGKIVNGEKNYLLNVESITFQQGMTVLLLTILLLEILLWITSLIISKRRFYR